MSWVILEGPDGTGKTTIAEQLRQAGYFYAHAGPEDTLPVLAKRMSELQGLKYVVWDRAHLGEAVYGPLDRGTTVNRGWWNLVEAFLLEKNAICVLLTEQHEDKTDYLGKSGSARYAEVLAGYERALPTSALTWKQRSSLPRGAVDNRDLEPWEWRTDPEGLGGVTEDNTFSGRAEDGPTPPSLPNVLVLGEQQNPLAEVPWPFATRCGIELVWPVINPREVRVSNALRSKGVIEPGDLHDRWEQLGCPKVITLGKIAHQACYLADIPVEETLSHPQYHLRFRTRESEVYRLRLAEACKRLIYA